MRARENAATRGRRYLTEGRIVITSVQPGQRVRAAARGDGRIHRLGWHAGRWWCDCPARTDACSHLIALRLVVAIDLKENP